MECIQLQKEKNYKFLKDVSKEKGIIFAIMCIERQLKVYERACKNHNWGNEEFYRKALDECWRYAIDKESFQDDILDLCDEYMPENLEPWTPMDDATIGATNVIISIISLIEVIINNDMERLLTITLENINFINRFLYNHVFNIIPGMEGEETISQHELMKSELEIQEIDKTIIRTHDDINEIRQYYDDTNIISILGKYWY